MTISFDLLPVEIQATIIDLRQAQVPELILDELITRTLAALGAKSNRVQVEVWQMEERLGAQLTQIGDKLQGDLQTQHGATNTMLADLNTAWLTTRPMIEEAGRGIAEIKKLWEELAGWRGRVEAVLTGLSEFRKESTSDRQAIRDAVSAQDHRHGEQIKEIVERLAAIEQLLEIAGQHEAGS